MFKFLKWLIGIFSPYANSFERKVDRFFKSVKSTDNIATIRKDLLKLMQENLIVVNVWMEKKYKGYKYLSKSVRRQMYMDVKEIVKKLENHCQTNKLEEASIKQRLSAKGLEFIPKDKEKLRYLAQIMNFLKPGEFYHYIQTASFGKLLRNPQFEKLEGDCNQIVTLYSYLYSLKFPIDDLQIKLLPEHVCLHFNGIDIEATNATFQKYKDSKQILPITEIISTNMLDLADFREKVVEISPRTVVKSAQLAYAISSLREVVTKNLNIAYQNLGVAAFKAKDFETAIFYFQKASDNKNILQTYRAATIYYMEADNFSKAKYFVSKSKDKDLERTVHYNEGVYFYKKDSIDEALRIFTALKDEKMKKACYAKEYNNLSRQVSDLKTIDQAKKKKHIFQKMLHLAQKMGESGLEKSVRDTLSKI